MFYPFFSSSAGIMTNEQLEPTEAWLLSSASASSFALGLSSSSCSFVTRWEKGIHASDTMSVVPFEPLLPVSSDVFEPFKEALSGVLEITDSVFLSRGQLNCPLHIHMHRSSFPWCRNWILGICIKWKMFLGRPDISVNDYKGLVLSFWLYS